MVRVFFILVVKKFKNDNFITSAINNLQGYTMIKIIFTTIFTRMTIQELLKILINFIRKKSAGIQRHRFCHSLNSKNVNINGVATPTQ